MPWSLLLLRSLEWFILRCNNFFVCFFFFFSHYHWWNRVFNICINSILHWIMSQKYWGLYRWMILLHNLNERPVSGRLNLIIYFLNKVDFLTWWSNQHHSYWHCYSQMPTYGHSLWIVNGRIKEHNPAKLLRCSNTAGQQVIKLSTQCWRLPIQRPSKGGQ